MEIPSSIREALKLSSSAYLISTVLMLFLPDPFKIKSTIWQLLVQQIVIYLETSVVSFYWERSLHLFQVGSFSIYFENTFKILFLSQFTNLCSGQAFVVLEVSLHSNCAAYKISVHLNGSTVSKKQMVRICSPNLRT